MRQALGDGELGVVWRFPDEWEVREDGDTQLVAVDHDHAMFWHVLFRPDGALDLGAPHREHLEIRLERYARMMFDNVHASVGTAETPRTADAEWSPMVDVEYIDVCGAPALRTIHRMIYEPGTEVVMGHVLVPTASGLLELRSTCRAEQTGYRESMLMVLLGDMTTHPGQAYFDDPTHDASFEHHPLSRTRAGLSAVLERFEAVTAPLPPAPAHLEVASARCVLEPPPRFRQMPGSITRVSFCTTDGVETLTVERDVVPEGANLEHHASTHIRDALESAGLSHVDTRATWLDDGSVAIRGAGVGHMGPLRHVFLWTPPRDGASFKLGLFGDGVSPEAELIDELWHASLTCRDL